MNAHAGKGKAGSRWALGTLLNLLLGGLLLFPVQSSAQTARCGELVRIGTHAGSSAHYALALPAPNGPAPVALLLLPGGSGFVNLDEGGCPRLLKGNSLIRSIPIFNEAGFATALLDAPTGYQGDDGLAGFRIEEAHAADIARAIADLRQRVGGPVWVLGTSRGSISAVNAASRLTGAAAPDGIVLTSALMVGDPRARKHWVAHSVFDLPLENIRVPTLVVGHAADACTRSPAGRMEGVLARTAAEREQLVTVTGGTGRPVQPGIDACEGLTPHGFAGQEAEVAAGIARFIRGGRY